jgi:hypothetical protein
VRRCHIAVVLKKTLRLASLIKDRWLLSVRRRHRHSVCRQLQSMFTLFHKLFL